MDLHAVDEKLLPGLSGQRERAGVELVLVVVAEKRDGMDVRVQRVAAIHARAFGCLEQKRLRPDDERQRLLRRRRARRVDPKLPPVCQLERDPPALIAGDRP